MISGSQPEGLVSVGELTKSIRGILESSLPFVKVLGEISNLRQPPSGHLYFTLKDEEAQLRAVFFKMQQRYATVRLTEGVQVICRGRISVYEARGEYQLLVDAIEEYGIGKLQLQFEALKRKLAGEGLFAPERKRPLPLLPRRVALVTSPAGAAVHDFLKTAAARFPQFPLLIVPVRVQGQGAASEMCQALRLIDRKKLADVVVLCRGGGSIEDLWEFNNEELARTIHRMDIPVVTGIGHEIDFTIADFVADHRAVTPTAAAEAVIPHREQLTSFIRQHQSSVLRCQQKLLADLNRQLATVKRQLREPRLLLHFLFKLDHLQEKQSHTLSLLLQRNETQLAAQQHRLAAQQPQQRLLRHDQWLSSLRRRLDTAMTFCLRRHEDRHARAGEFLQAVSPQSILKRGYALVSTMQDRLITDIAEAEAGQRLQIRFYKGKMQVTVLKTVPEE